ncbi:MAG TPA: winged helix-turn-helix transcriptional regulator [Chloroflexi bacterium]|nr:winged helix-turn-helix transcriptional regulator [Chloroflexota bacterium]
MKDTTQARQDLHILENIEKNPEITQADLAAQLGVAVGSVNWYIKRLVKKGYVKVTRMQRRRLRYLITPQGIAKKTYLTRSFMQASLKWYRETRSASKALLAEIKNAGYDTVCIRGDGDLTEVVYLSCLEAGMSVKEEIDPAYPLFRVENFQTVLDWPKGRE